MRDNSKPASLAEFDAPTADATRSIPVVWGTCLLDSPNITWYGDLQTVKLEEKVKTGIFSSTKQTLVFRYSIGIQFVLCQGPVDKLHQVRTEDKVAFSGNVISTDGMVVAFDVDAKEIYGGDWKDQLEAGGEGGVYARCDFYPGSAVQAENSYMQTVLGVSLPGYRDTCQVVWQGPTSGQKTYAAGRAEPYLSGFVGDSPNLKNFSFVVQRCPKLLAIYDGQDVDPDAETPATCYLNRTAEGTSDANPVEVIYELLVDDKFGAGIATSLIDIDAFVAASATVAGDENLVFSAVWDTPREVRDVIDDILAYIDGIVYTDPITGLITIKLVRDTDSLILAFTKDDIVEVSSYSRKAWDESINEVRLNYTDRFDLRDGVRTYRDKTAIAQDLANQRIQEATVATNTSYIGISGPTTAANIARRDLKNLTIPLSKITIKTRRLVTYEDPVFLTLKALTPGDKISISHPDIVGDFFRVTRVAYGELTNGICEIEAIQDVFGLVTTLYATPNSSSFTSPVGDPVTPTVFSNVELPYFYSNDEIKLQAFVAKPNTSQLNFNTYASVGASGGPYTVIDRGNGFTPTGTLDSSYPEVTSDVSTTNMVITASSPNIMTFLTDQTSDYIKTGANLLMVNNEIMAYEDVQPDTPSAGKFTLVNVWRGLLDTVPTAHASGSRVWFFSYGDSQPATTFGSGLTVYTKYTSAVGTNESALSSSTNIVTKRRGLKPYPPGNIRINSSTSTTTLSNGSNIQLDWSHRNRIQQGQIVYKQFDSSITSPEQNTQYFIKFFNASNTLLRTVGPLTTTTYTYLNADQVSDNSAVEPLVVTYQIYSKREGLFSLFAQQRTLLRTGGTAPSPPAYSPGSDTYVPTTPGDASSIQGTPASTSTPSSGQVLVYNASSGQYEPTTIVQPPFLDSNALIKGSVDATKLFRFEVDGFSSGVTRVATPPNEDFTIVGLATSQTLTNKTITNSNNTLGRVTLTLGSDATADVYYRDSGGLLTRLAIGTNGQVLTVSSGLPSWQTPSGGGGSTFADNVFRVQDNGDATKQLAFECSGITTGTTRTLTIPNFDGTIATLAGTETFTNKTLTSPKINVTSDGTGDVYYRDSGGNFTRLAIGSAGQVLQVSSGLPSWQTVSGTSTFLDSVFRVQDDGDNTKQFALQCSGIATATTRTWTVPDANSTFVGTDTTQTLTNKTLTSPAINFGSDANGDIIYRTGGAYTRLPIGTNGQVLTVSSGLPSWAASGGGSSPPFDDGTAIIKGSADATKLLRIEVDGFTTGTTRVLTAPNFDGTIATLAGTETFTNKTLTSPVINVTSDTTGDTYYRSSGGIFTRLPIGSSGQVLTVASGLPSWATPSGGGGGDSTTSDTYANRPAAGNDGNLFFPTDTMFIQRDTGSVWETWAPSRRVQDRTAPPTIASSSWTNINHAGSTSATDVGSGILLTDTQTGGNTNAYYRFLKKAAPSTPYTIVLGLEHYFAYNQPSGTIRFGFIGRQSSDGRILFFGYTPSNGSNVNGVIRAISIVPTGTSPNLQFTDSATAGNTYMNIPNLIFIKYEDNGTNRIMSVSRDFGNSWIQILSESRTATLTVDEVGFGFLIGTATNSNMGFTLFHWKES